MWEGVGEGEVAARRRAVDAAAGAGQHRDGQTDTRAHTHARTHSRSLLTDLSIAPGGSSLATSRRE